MADNPIRRDARLRIACGRCQRRKIRCDGLHPTCSNCRKAAAECIDGESVRLRAGPNDRAISSDRATINRLRRRIRWLETVVRERLPDVDLSSTPPQDELEDAVIERLPTDSSIAAGSNQGPQNNAITDLAPAQSTAPDQPAHQIGLISIGFNADEKYIGPSSGYFLARLLLARARKSADLEQRVGRSTSGSQPGIDELVTAVHGPLPLPPQTTAVQLFQRYFEIIQPQYPFLHEGSLRSALDELYRAGESENVDGARDASVRFQVFMVLAISATLSTWRTKRQLHGESYCLSALQYLDRIRIGSSLEGLQCMLLLLVFAMHCPHMQLNVWHLNYQCLAAVIDLGLQRQVTTSAGISLLEQELRTRIFWTVYTIDRTVASMMGRPIGLRDEACELRLPQLLEDNELAQAPTDTSTGRSNMAVSIHLFRLAKLNSEIKYVANSIVRDVPPYAYPAIRDVAVWQGDMLQQLNEWAAAIPQTQPRNEYIALTCEIRCLALKMLLLRPSPAIPTLTAAAMTSCYKAAHQSLQLYRNLYRSDLVLYDWITVHGVVYSIITALYCIKVVPEIARGIHFADIMEDLSAGISVLSATGEHWSGAKRARDILEDMGNSTIRWLRQTRQSSLQEQSIEHEVLGIPNEPSTEGNASMGQSAMWGQNNDNVPPNLDFLSAFELDLDLFPELQRRQESFGDTVNIDDIMRNLFDDFIPSSQTLY